MAHDAFISYASEDQVVATAVCAKLEERGIRCWIAPRDLRAGTFAAQLITALKDCKVVVLIFSEHANCSLDVNREIENAFAEGKTVIPFRIANIVPADSLLYYMRGVHWLDALTPPLEEHIQRLASEIAWKLNVPQEEVRAQPLPTAPARTPVTIRSAIRHRRAGSSRGSGIGGDDEESRSRAPARRYGSAVDGSGQYRGPHSVASVPRAQR